MRVLRFALAVFLIAFTLSAQGAVGLLSLASTNNYPFGVNLSGPEYAPWNGQQFPTVANWDYLQTKGIKFVRLPLAWESLQPTLSAALDPTYVASITTALSRAAARGIGVVLDIHNFAHYCDQAHWVSSGCGYAGNAGAAGTGVSVLGDVTLTQAAFVDLWTRMAQTFGPLAGVAGYDLMNEPIMPTGKQLLFAPNGFGDGIGSQPWFAASGSAVTQLASGTNPLGANYGPAWIMDSGSGFGGYEQSLTLSASPVVLSVYAQALSGTETMNLGIVGDSVNKTVTTAWTRFEYSFTPSAGSQSILIGVNAGAGHSFRIANAQLELGSTATSYLGSNWYPYAQAAITAIRALDARPIYVTNSSWGACEWPWTSWDVLTLTGGNLIFEAHQYFDGSVAQCGGGGLYSGTYTSYGITTDAGVTEMTPFANWTITTGAKGYVGELNVPNDATDNDPQWLILQRKVWNYLEPNRIPATIWFFNSGTLQSSNVLGVAPQAGVDDPRLTTMLAVGQ